MALFCLYCIDRPNSLEVRLGARADHLAYVGAFAERILVAGPLLDDEGGMRGSMILMDFEDRAAAEAFCAADPYVKAGLFERVEIRPMRASIGTAARP